jgi:hypothetical protein
MSEAIGIAESLCGIAKDRAREVCKDEYGKFDLGCWVNFEIIRGSAGNDSMKDKYDRPYRVIASPGKAESVKYAQFNDLHSVLGNMRRDTANEDENTRPARNALKALRNAALLGDFAAVESQMHSRGQYVHAWLPDDTMETLGSEDGKGDKKYRILHEALDLMDVECGFLTTRPDTLECEEVQA